MHEKGSRDKACPRCQIFGCANKASKDESECDIFCKPTTARVARIAKSDKYKLKVEEYRKEKKQEALDHAPTLSAHAYPSDDLSDSAYSALVQSLLDDEDDVESEFSRLK